MSKFKLAFFATLIAAAVLATAALASTKTSTIALKSTAVGKVVVGANGRTLYLFTADKGKKSACYGQCASYWPPLIAGKPTAGTGLNAAMLGTTKREDGKLQVTYHGHPLYYFLLDKKAGDVKGQGYVHFGGPGGSSRLQAGKSRRSSEQRLLDAAGGGSPAALSGARAMLVQT